MNISEAINAIRSGGSVSMIIPSLERTLLFKPLNTGYQKTLGRIALGASDRYNSGLMRLALFEDLLLEDKHEIKPSILKIVDIVAFLAQLKLQINPELKASFICPKCNKSTEVSINLKKVIENCVAHEFKKFSVKMSGGSPKHDYEFVIEEPNYMDILILMESVRRSKSDLADTVTEAEFYYAYSKVCLYVSKVIFDGQEIVDGDKPFNKFPVQERLKFFDSMDQTITIDETNENSLINIIIREFSDEELSKNLFKGTTATIKCSNKECGNLMESALTYDNFFML